MSLIRNSIERMKIMLDDVGVDISRSQHTTRTIAYYIRECLYSPRRTDATHPDTWETIKDVEKKRGNTTKFDIFTTSGLYKPDGDFEHGNVAGHTLSLYNYFLQYPCTDNKILKRNLILAFLIHDLGEKKLWDHSQQEGPKTDIFRNQEYLAGKEEIALLFSDQSDLYNEIAVLFEELQNKESRLYMSLKVYEEISHIEGTLALYYQGKIDYSDMKQWLDTHKARLVEKEKYYPCITGYYRDLEERILL